MSIQLQRTNSDISRILQSALTQRLTNPLFSTVQILNTETSSDLSICKVYVDIRHEDPGLVLAQLGAASGALRNEISSNVKIRRTPNLKFIHDQGRQNADRVEELLRVIAKKDQV